MNFTKNLLWLMVLGILAGPHPERLRPILVQQRTGNREDRGQSGPGNRPGRLPDRHHPGTEDLDRPEKTHAHHRYHAF